MSDQKFHSRSHRRRPQTGRVVLNRRGRILNNAPHRTTTLSQEGTKPVDELTVGIAQKSVLISENDPNFTMLDQGSFMIFKANKTDDKAEKTTRDTTIENKAIKSKIISKKQIDKKSSRAQRPAEHAAPEVIKTGNNSADRYPHSAPDVVSSTVIPLRIINRRTSSEVSTDHPVTAPVQPVVEDIKAISQPDPSNAIRHQAEAEITPEAVEESPQYPAPKTAPITDEAISSDTISSDSEKQTLPALPVSASDDQILRNWHIGAEIGATINAIVADELGQQVRRITRSVIQDMVRDGTLDLGQKK